MSADETFHATTSATRRPATKLFTRRRAQLDDDDGNFSRDDERNSMTTTETFRRDAMSADENFSRDDERDAMTTTKTFSQLNDGDENFFTRRRTRRDEADETFHAPTSATR
jgi:hypothetical protein